MTLGCNNEIARMQRLPPEAIKRMEGVEYDVDRAVSDNYLQARCRVGWRSWSVRVCGGQHTMGLVEVDPFGSLRQSFRSHLFCLVAAGD